VKKMSVGNNIRRLRETKGISQVQLAKDAGITQAMLCQIERETKNPSLQVGAEIARLLDCPLESLLNVPCEDGEKRDDIM